MTDTVHAPATLCDAYGFEQVTLGERLEGGFANDLFRVRADGRELVLRIKLPPVCEPDVAWEHRLVAALSDQLPDVSRPLSTRDARTFIAWGERVAWLMPFVAGAPADAACERHRAAAARALGRLHRTGRELDPGPRPRLSPVAELAWPQFVVADELRDWRETIRCERTWAIDYVAKVARERELVTSLVHGDFFPGNVLLANGEVVAMIDWEEAQPDWLTWDLANAVGTFCTAGEDVDRDAMRSFVAAYRAGGGIAPPHDDDLLIPFVRVKRILEVLRAPADRDPRWDHQRDNLRSLEALSRPARPRASARPCPSSTGP